MTRARKSWSKRNRRKNRRPGSKKSRRLGEARRRVIVPFRRWVVKVHFQLESLRPRAGSCPPRAAEKAPRPALKRGFDLKTAVWDTRGCRRIRKVHAGYHTALPKWWNWQTRMVQVHVLARVWGFESPLRHQISIFRLSDLRVLKSFVPITCPIAAGWDSFVAAGREQIGSLRCLHHSRSHGSRRHLSGGRDLLDHTATPTSNRHQLCSAGHRQRPLRNGPGRYGNSVGDHEGASMRHSRGAVDHGLRRPAESGRAPTATAKH